MDDPITVPITLEAGAAPPEYATPGAAGMDVRAIEPVELAPGERLLVRTGLRIAVPSGYEAQMRPRSGLAIRHGIGMVNSPGTIDSDYRGELRVILVNHGAEPVRLDRGERIGQLVLCPVARAAWRIVEDLEETDRGERGFGSTGKH